MTVLEVSAVMAALVMTATPLKLTPPFPTMIRGMLRYKTIRARSTTTRDRNLQFRGAVSTGGSPLDFWFFSPAFMCNLVRRAP